MSALSVQLGSTAVVSGAAHRCEPTTRNGKEKINIKPRRMKREKDRWGRNT